MQINNAYIIDHLQSFDFGKEYIGSAYLIANQKYQISADYIEELGNANIKLFWWSKNQAKEIIPKSQLYTKNIPPNTIQSKVTQSIQTYPNPANNYLTLSSESKIISVTIYNSQGVKINTTYPQSNTVKLSTAQLQNGFFFMDAQTATDRIYHNFMVQHR